MMTAENFFFESGWGFALSIIAFVSLIINFIQLIHARKTRILRLAMNFESFGKQIKDLLERVNSNIEIPHLARFSFELKNIGNVDLIPEDFISPIEIRFDTVVEFLDLRINDSYVYEKCSQQEKTKLIINPFLLKSNEELTITGFISSKLPVQTCEPFTRIKEFKISNEFIDRDNSSWIRELVIIILITLILYLVAYYSFAMDDPSPWVIILGSSLAGVLFAIFSFRIKILFKKRYDHLN